MGVTLILYILTPVKLRLQSIFEIVMGANVFQYDLGCVVNSGDEMELEVHLAGIPYNEIR
jgi:hypothetical protein